MFIFWGHAGLGSLVACGIEGLLFLSLDGGNTLHSLQYSSLEAKLCQVESKYLILLQEMKTPVCSEEQGPARDVIAQLLEDALQVESQEQPEQAFVKPHLVR